MKEYTIKVPDGWLFSIAMRFACWLMIASWIFLGVFWALGYLEQRLIVSEARAKLEAAQILGECSCQK